MGLILFIHVVPGLNARRRVVSHWEADGAGGHRQVFGWNPSSDKFKSEGRLTTPAGLDRYERFLRRLAGGAPAIAAVRRKTVEFYDAKA